jgi:hypothetical protein
MLNNVEKLVENVPSTVDNAYFLEKVDRILDLLDVLKSLQSLCDTLILKVDNEFNRILS